MHTREVRRAVEELFAAQYDALRSGQPDEVDEFLEAYYAPHSTVIGSSGRALGLEEVRAQILDGDVVMMHALRSVDSISFLGDGESAVATCTAEEVSSSWLVEFGHDCVSQGLAVAFRHTIENLVALV